MICCSFSKVIIQLMEGKMTGVVSKETRVLYKNRKFCSMTLNSLIVARTSHLKHVVQQQYGEDGPGGGWSALDLEKAVGERVVIQVLSPWTSRDEKRTWVFILWFGLLAVVYTMLQSYPKARGLLVALHLQCHLSHSGGMEMAPEPPPP